MFVLDLFTYSWFHLILRSNPPTHIYTPMADIVLLVSREMQMRMSQGEAAAHSSEQGVGKDTEGALGS